MEDEPKYFESFVDDLLSALDQKLLFAVNKVKLISLSQDLIKKNLPLASDAASVGHIKMCSVMIALFGYLKDKMPLDNCLAIIKYAFVDSLIHITYQTEEFLNESSNPFKDVVSISKQKEVEYGDSFKFYRKKDNDQSYLLEVKQCFYCKLLTTNNAKELMPIFCDFDTLWMKAIKPETHGFKFERPETIGTGGEVCKFYFTKTLK
ncbi:MAG: L-2-amino-thiazoline-4-carboxylic acid hydrolase [Bacteroidota bacterium]